MIEFRQLPDDHPDLAHSPMLRAALTTLQYVQEHGSIGLTKTKAFKRKRRSRPIDFALARGAMG
jgi:hypothetical protein